MRFQNKTIDRLRKEQDAGEITREEYDIRVNYFVLGYDLGHQEGYDEGDAEECCIGRGRTCRHNSPS
tara:strand:+ start:1059 stop:1259 length:201 start_codon:yes stop_codon:yes gene_type:complete